MKTNDTQQIKLLVYSAKNFEIPYLKEANNSNFRVTYIKEALDTTTAIKAASYNAISIFSGDDASSIVLEKLWELGVRYISIRSAGYNNIRIKSAKRFGFRVANAPDYSPYAVAEHAAALLLALNRKIVLADKQVHAFNFLQDNLLGIDLHGKTVGIIGTGRIGSIMVKIMHGFGCNILANDLSPDNDLVELCNVTYTTIDELCKKSDIISLHIPLTYENYSFINKKKLNLMKPGVILINTARGAVVETEDLINALKSGKIGGYCTDVYKKEKGIFFRDNSKTGITDEGLKTLLSMDNVLLTPHQGFVTKEALTNIAKTTFYNLNCWAEGKESEHELGLELMVS